ncbi:hypothetical protein HAX54_016512 [Datura stramonium]|uniref:Transmembrane protein n=1 Tax=Datura stramonium TaxID=4076 RepID=A0ABS8S0P1_DATST|nr:hypothetical protein [Datura stramonium]
MDNRHCSHITWISGFLIVGVAAHAAIFMAFVIDGQARKRPHLPDKRQQRDWMSRVTGKRLSDQEDRQPPETKPIHIEQRQKRSNDDPLRRSKKWNLEREGKLSEEIRNEAEIKIPSGKTARRDSFPRIGYKNVLSPPANPRVPEKKRASILRAISDPPDKKLNPHRRESVWTYPPRDSWNFVDCIEKNAEGNGSSSGPLQLEVVYGIGVTFIEPLYYSPFFSRENIYGYSDDF